jgi:serine/threonine protein kinase
MFYQEEDTILKHRGTTEFIAPECFKPKGTTTTQYYSGRAVDVWALGITIYIMVFNELPFPAKKGTDIPNEI